MKHNVLDVLRAAGDSLAYEADALEAPASAHMREVARDTVEAWDTVSALIVALNQIVDLERRGGSSQSIRMLAVAAVKQARGEA
jgi:hypothetical protein